MVDLYFGAGTSAIIKNIAVTIRELHFISAIIIFNKIYKAFMVIAVYEVDTYRLLEIKAQQVSAYKMIVQLFFFTIFPYFIFMICKPST